jgi:hypothetical protein
MAQSALIRSQTSLPCAMDRCGSFASFVRRSLGFNRVEEQRSALLPATTSFAPDVILLRLSDKPASETLVSAYRAKWNLASILAVFCGASLSFFAAQFKKLNYAVTLSVFL